MKIHKPLIIANWKNHPASLREAKQLFDGVKRRTARMSKVSVVVCPPTLYLGMILSNYQGSSISLGAQDLFWESEGSHTGMTTPALLHENGVGYVIIGHSERRAAGETADEVAQKIQAARKAKLKVVLCVGERERDVEGVYLRVLEEQILQSLEGVSRQKVTTGFTVAYEPVWAIGKSAEDALDAHGVHQMVLFIKKILVKKYGKKAGMSIPILYGGSVEPSNAQELSSDAGVDGVLVGHASRVPEDFADIARSFS